jgi:N-acetylglutamate synthase-like GNAT family acetyltransferase
MGSLSRFRVIVRPAGVDDLSTLATFILPFVADERLLPRTSSELEELIDSGFVAVAEGRIIGFAALEIYSAKLAEIRSLAVSSEWQGRGVGKQLVDACVSRAHEKDVLEVMAVTSSESFFRSCGFDFTLPGEKKALFFQTRDG